MKSTSDFELLAPIYHINIVHNPDGILVTLQDDPTQPPPSTRSILRNRLHMLKERHWIKNAGDAHVYWHRSPDKYGDEMSLRLQIEEEEAQREAAESYQKHAKMMKTRVPGLREALMMASLGDDAWRCVLCCERLVDNWKNMSFRFSLVKFGDRVEVTMFAIEGVEERELYGAAGSDFTRALYELWQKLLDMRNGEPEYFYIRR